MEVTIQVDGESVAANVRELLDSMTPEQRGELAKAVLLQALKDTECRFAKRTGIDKALVTMNEGRDQERGKFQYTEEKGLQIVGATSSYYNRIHSDDNRRFNNLTDYHADSRAYFRDKILPVMLEVATEHTRECVEGNEKIQTAIAAAVKEIEDDIPNMVKAAMESLFSTVMFNSMRAAELGLVTAQDNSHALSQIQERLNRAGIY